MDYIFLATSLTSFDCYTFHRTFAFSLSTDGHNADLTSFSPCYVGEFEIINDYSTSKIINGCLNKTGVWFSVQVK